MIIQKRRKRKTKNLYRGRMVFYLPNEEEDC